MVGDSAVVSEVGAAYRHYIDLFNRRAGVEFAECYDCPQYGVSGEHGLTAVNTDADHERWYEQVMATADEQGWDRTGIDRLQIWPLSESVAQLLADVTRYKKDGSVIARIRANYIVRRRDGRWRVMTYGVVEQPFSGPGVPHPELG